MSLSLSLSLPLSYCIHPYTNIILLEFKKTSDTSETHYSDMITVAEKQHAPILKGLNALAEELGWGVEVLAGLQ